MQPLITNDDRQVTDLMRRYKTAVPDRLYQPLFNDGGEIPTFELIKLLGSVWGEGTDFPGLL